VARDAKVQRVVEATRQRTVRPPRKTRKGMKAPQGGRAGGEGGRPWKDCGFAMVVLAVVALTDNVPAVAYRFHADARSHASPIHHRSLHG
ncbi:hypothetical protein DIPPA_05356, partial [Diplonema papillatum]